MEEIPTVEGFVLPGFSGYALGANGWSRVGGAISGSGIDDKVVLASNRLWDYEDMERVIVHEYFHHIWDSGLFDIKEFERQYDRMKLDENLPDKYKIELKKEKGTLAEKVNQRVSKIGFWQRRFGVTKEEEAACYIAEEVTSDGEVPKYLREVYKEVLRWD